MSKTRLLYVTSQHSLHDWRFLNLLSKDPAFEVFFTTCEPAPLYPEIYNLDVQILDFPLRKLNVEVPVLRRICHEYRYWRFVSFLRRMIDMHKIDIVHSGYLIWDSYAALKTGFHPILAMSWGSDVLDNPHAKTPHNSRTFRRRLISTAQNADAVYSDSQTVAEALVQITGIPKHKIHVFPQLGIDVDAFQFGRTMGGGTIRKLLQLEGKKVFLGLRNFRPVYGVEDLIQAMPMVVEEDPSVYLLLGGDGPLRGHLEGVVNELGLREYVHFLGQIQNAHLPDYYHAAAWYVSTSLSDGSSITLMEAMSSGLPVVVTDVPSNLEWVHDSQNGFIAKRGDSQSIASAMLKAAACEEEKALFGERNREIALERADIQKNYKRLVALYQHLLKDRSDD